MSDISKSLVPVTCVDCGIKYNTKYNTYTSIRRKNPDNPQFRCPDCATKFRAKKMAERMANMSAEEKAAMYKKAGDKHSKQLAQLTPEQKKARMESVNKGRDKWLENRTEEERQRISQIHSESNRRRWESMTDEQRKLESQKAKERWENKTVEEKNKHSQYSIDMWKNKTEEERNSTIKKMSESRKQIWNDIDEESLKKLSQKISNTLTKYFASLTPEQKKIMSDRAKEYYDSLSDEDKLRISEQHAEITSERWKNASEEEKLKQVEYLKKGRKEWYDSLTDEEKHEYAVQRGENYKKWWSSLSDQEREEISNKKREYYYSLPDEEKIRRYRNILSVANGKNKFHQKFEKYFNESHLGKMFHLIGEICTTDDDNHFWDYGVFDENDKLVAVVDLDGAYFHADNCDYDGIHSKEEYDEKRFLSIPEGVKCCIMLELDFVRSFDRLVRTLMMNYDEYVESTFRELRNMPFPYPHYTDNELLKSFESLNKLDCEDNLHASLSLNTRIGDRIIQHFHSTIWHDSCGNSLSPYKAWQRDDLLKDIIKNRIIFQSTLNSNKILQGFNVTKKAPKVSVFSAGRAKMIINRYLPEFTTIFDPFSGYSGRMLGAISLGKRYIGQDYSIAHVNESNKIIQFLTHYGIRCNSVVVAKDILESSGSYECLFTCPPYGMKERWVDVPISTKTCDDWIDECLKRFKCRRYVFVVDKTEKYKDYVVDYIESKSHITTSKEYVIVINK